MPSQQEVDAKRKIESALRSFQSGSLRANAIAFFDALGYRSNKSDELEPNTPKGLLDLVNRPDFLNPQRAQAHTWQSVDFLFQLTDEDVQKLGKAAQAFDSKVGATLTDKQIDSYIFFAIDLKNSSCSRTQLADMTREVNRLFPMPALVLFKYSNTLTLAIINRRIHKRDSALDVLEKVTLIKDIRYDSPHRGHTEILYDIAFPQLAGKHAVTNFIQLDDAWRKALDSSTLNERFYADLANWYYWALSQVEFPKQEGIEDDVNRATNVIRLITRLIFVWFLRERDLVPTALFDRNELSNVLKDLSDDKSTFYKGILQNLFFATLNTPMNDPKAPRVFRKATGGQRLNSQYMVHNQYRYENVFRSREQGLGLFAAIPFLNGGLFECLDKRVEVNGKLWETRIDGFSDVPKKQPRVPNKLFFSSDEDVDLNEIYGTRNKQYTVRGIINTLDSYKFTIAENTPIEEEVALDPELLGKVFENLLASYNPETGATARKQTGSFYTPREVVNYMVDESLIAYLENQLSAVERGHKGGNMNLRLRQLLSYTDELPEFTDKEIDELIEAVDRSKILDPACGSGAFPMGILQKLVFILSKLDPQNKKWEMRQIERVRDAMRAAEKIEDHEFRESTLQDLQAQISSIEEAFALNELDYGRKLFLIENCIYGVDIQPIAMQIAKLRFFISLIIDQRIRPEADNLGIRPLPNLETKFVAANTLLRVEKPAQAMLQNEELRRAIEKKERELRIVRESHFTARTTKTKERYRKEDERLREEIGKLLQADNWAPETTSRLIAWNPYDQNATAQFFDPEWMFGTDRFDIVIGNPPYGVEFDASMKTYIHRNYRSYKYKYESYAYFIERALEVTASGGCVNFITPEVWLRLETFAPLRQVIAKLAGFERLKVYGENVFAASVVNTIVSTFRVGKLIPNLIIEENDSSWQMETKQWSESPDLSIDYRLRPNIRSLIEKIRISSTHLSQLGDAIQGITPYDKYRGQSGELIKRRGYHFSYKHDKSCGKWLDGADVGRYTLQWSGEWLSYGPWLGAPREPRFFKGPRLLFREIPGRGKRLQATIAHDTYYHGHSITPFKPHSTGPDLRYLLGLINSRLMSWYASLTLPNFGKDIFPKLNPQDIKALPIALTTSTRQLQMSKRVDQILDLKIANPSADISRLENEIDELVYEIYQLSSSEQAIIEASVQT